MLKFFAQSGYLLAFLATIIWSGNFIVARGLNETYSAITIAFFRWGIAAIVITPLAYRAIKRDLHLLRKQWKLVLMLAIIGVSIFNTLIYQAAHSTPALNLSLIAITAPLYVVILNRIVFKEFLTKRQISGLIILFFGLLLLLSNGDLSALLSLSFNIGDLLMAMAASLFGVYSVLAGKKLMGNLSFVAVTIIIGELLLLPVFIGEQLLSSQPFVFTTSTVLQLLYIGIGPSIISFYLWNRSIMTIGSTKAAAIYNTLPVCSAFFAFIILDEPITFIQIISSLVIVAGVLLILQSRK